MISRAFDQQNSAPLVQAALAGTIVVILLGISAHSLFFFTISLCLTLLLAKLFELGRARDVATAYLLYAAAAIFLSVSLRMLLPAFYGMSGPEGGFGTDDGYYFSLASPVLPPDFPTRPHFQAYSHPFAAIFRPVAELAHAAFGRVVILDLVFPALVFMTLTPFATRALASLLGDEDTARRAFVLSAICPFMLANGLILVRDVWVAGLLVMTLLFALQRRYGLLLLVIGLSLYIRVGTGALAVLGAAIFLAMNLRLEDGHVRISLGRRTIWLFALYIVVALLGLAALVAFLGLDTILFAIDRSDFIKMYIGGNARADAGTSTLYNIALMPWYLSVPLGSLFFFGSPFFDALNIVFSGTASGFVLYDLFNPRAALAGLFSILFVFYVGWFYRGVVRGIAERNMGMLVLFAFFLVCLVAFSQFSLVIRQKIAIQPVFYVLTAYGIGYLRPDIRFIGYLGGVAVLMLNLAVTVGNLNLF